MQNPTNKLDKVLNDVIDINIELDSYFLKKPAPLKQETRRPSVHFKRKKDSKKSEEFTVKNL